MALLFECTQKCCRKRLDTADIVRDTMLRQPPTDNTTKLRPFIDLPHWQT